MFTAKISWIFVKAFKKISRGSHEMRVSSGLAATVGKPTDNTYFTLVYAGDHNYLDLLGGGGRF